MTKEQAIKNIVENHCGVGIADDCPFIEAKEMDENLKIGQEVFIHGYVDEIRKDVIIIRNEGGYFGTVKEEIVYTKMVESEV